MNIITKENVIADKFIRSEVDRMSFVWDGLCYASMNPDLIKKAEEMYLSMEPRIVFLGKEPNGNALEDYRDWKWAERPSQGRIFGDSIALWAEGLNRTHETKRPAIVSQLHQNREIFSSLPVCIVNVKKTEGANKSDWQMIRNAANENAAPLREQLSLYSPNVIVCMGSTQNAKDSMLYIVKTYIYPDLIFRKINNWCHYCKEKDLLLIDSWHPSYILNEKEKFDDMFEAYCEFLNLKDTLKQTDE